MTDTPLLFYQALLHIHFFATHYKCPAPLHQEIIYRHRILWPNRYQQMGETLQRPGYADLFFAVPAVTIENKNAAPLLSHYRLPVPWQAYQLVYFAKFFFSPLFLTRLLLIQVVVQFL